MILYKLHYFTISHQPKHVRDITSIVRSLGGSLDMAYLEQWTTRLGLVETWQEILGQILGDEGFLF